MILQLATESVERLILDARMRAGRALCEGASRMAQLGRSMLGNPTTALKSHASKGTDVIVLDRQVPSRACDPTGQSGPRRARHDRQGARCTGRTRPHPG